MQTREIVDSPEFDTSLVGKQFEYDSKRELSKIEYGIYMLSTYNQAKDVWVGKSKETGKEMVFNHVYPYKVVWDSEWN